ncbi:MAG: hypothetical protein ACLQHL_12535 [Candidatus Cybelea sp.]
MRIFEFARYGLMSCAAAALLAGCGASTPAGTPARTAVGQARPGTWMSANTSSANLVYIGEGSKVLVFSFTGKQVGELTGLSGTGAICSDSQGNVWVGYDGSLLEYNHGGTVPIAQLYLQPYYIPRTCAVDPTTGDIAVVEYSYQSQSHPENVAVYQNIYEPPQTYSDVDFFYSYLGYDDHGNLFVNGTGGHRGQVPLFDELPQGGSSFERLSFDVSFRTIGGLQWDGQYLALGDAGNHVVYQVSVSNGYGTTQSSTHFHNWRDKGAVPFAIEDGIIVFAFNRRQVGYYDFPAGGKAVRLIGLTSTAGITISVPPTPRRGGSK